MKITAWAQLPVLPLRHLLGAAGAPARRSPIARALSALPASSFDNTTDGLTKGDLRRLIATGDSDDWLLTKTGPRSAVATAKHPASTVTVTIHDVGGKDVVRVIR